MPLEIIQCSRRFFSPQISNGFSTKVHSDRSCYVIVHPTGALRRGWRWAARYARALSSGSTKIRCITLIIQIIIISAYLSIQWIIGVEELVIIQQQLAILCGFEERLRTALLLHIYIFLAAYGRANKTVSEPIYMRGSCVH